MHESMLLDHGTVGPRAGLIAAGVFAVMALGGWATPHFDNPAINVDASAARVATLIRAAAHSSSTRGVDVVVSFDTLRNHIRLADRTADHSAAARRLVRSPAHGGRFAAPPVRGIRGRTLTAPWEGAAIEVLDSLPSVVFRADGTAAADLVLYLTTHRDDPRAYRALVVSRSGQTTTHRWSGRTWVRAD